MANGGTIQFGIKYNVDQSSLNNIKKNLQEMQRMTTAAFSNVNKTGITNTGQELSKVKQTAQDVENALERAFNPNLNTYNLTQLNRELNKIGIDKIYNDFQKMGTAGQSAFRGIVTQIATTNQQLKQSHKLIDDFAKTMGNTIKWGITSSIMNTFTGSVERAYGYVKNLDTSLNDIRIVTNQSAEEMEKFAVKANNAAKALGSSTLDYTKASLIYYQQGLSEQEVEARANVTLKAANVTGQSGEAVSEQLTAIWNGYKVSAEEAEMYIDKVSAVAAATAADLEELSTGMSKVASAANAMGVDVDQLNAQLATIVSVTRQAPESVGTALKTIYARMSDLKLGETDEDGLGLGDVSGTMESMGIEVLDATGNLRDMGDVIEDVAAKWDTWTEAQKTAMAQVMAGKRQYNNLVALFDNWDMYTDALETSENATGTLAQQNEIYLESVEAHLQQLSTATEDLYDSLFNAESFKDLIDFGTDAINIFGDFIDSIGGGGTALTALGGIATRVFSKNIAEGLQTTISNLRVNNEELENAQLQAKMLQDVFKAINKNPEEEDKVAKDIATKGQQISQYSSTMTSDQYKEGAKLLEDYASAADKKDIFDTKIEKAEEYLNKLEGLEDVKLTSPFDEYTYFEALAKAEESIDATTEAWSNFNDAAIAALDNGDSLPALTEIISTVNNMKNTLGLTEKQLKDYKDAAKEYLHAKNDPKATAQEQEKAFRKLRKTIGDLTGKLREENEQATQLVEQGGDALGNQSKQLANAKEQTEKALDNFTKKLSEAANLQGIIDVVGGLEQMNSAIKSIQAIPDIWENNELNGGEKLLQTISSLTFALPMLANGFSAVKNGMGAIKNTWTGLKQSFTETYTTLAAEGAALSANTIAHQANADAAKDSENARNGSGGLVEGIQENTEEIISDTTQEAAEEVTEQLDNVTESVDNVTGAMGNAASSGATLGNALKGLGSRALGALKAMAPMLVVLASVAAAVGMVTLAYNHQQEVLNEANENLKQANQQLATAKQIASDTENAFESLTSKINNLNNIQSSLDTLVEGTDEWASALKEARQTTEELLELYPQLAQGATYENSLIKFDEEQLKKVEEEEQQKVENAQLGEFLAKRDVANLQQDKEASDLAQIFLDKNAGERVWETVETGLAAGLAAGASAFELSAPLTPLWQAVTTVSATVLGAGAGVAASLYEQTLYIEDTIGAYDSAIEKLSKADYSQYGTDEDFKKFLTEKLDLNDQALIDSMVEMKSELINAANELKANTAAQTLLTKQFINERFSSKEAYAKSSNQNLLNAILANSQVRFENSDQYKTLVDQWAGTAESGAKTSEELASTYSKMMFGDKAVTHTFDENGNYVFKDENDEELAVISGQAMAETIVSTLNLENLERNLEGIANRSTEIYERFSGADTEGFEEALTTFVGGESGKADLSSLTKEQINQMRADLEANEYALADEMKASYGWESGKAIFNEFKAAQEREQKARNEVLNNFKGTEGAFDVTLKAISEKETVDGLKQIQKVSNEVFFALGKEGQNAFEKVLFSSNKLGVDMSDLAGLIDTIDWTSPIAMGELQNQLETLGYNIDINTEEWQDFIEQMRIAALASGDFNKSLSALRETLTSINSLTGDIQIGDIVSDKEFAELKKINPEIEKFFTLTSDGFKYVGGQEGSLKDFLKDSLPTIDDYKELAKQQEAGANAVKEALSAENSQSGYSLFSQDTSENKDEARNFLKQLDETVLNAIGLNSAKEVDEVSPDLLKAYFDQIDSLITNAENGVFDAQRVEELYVNENIKNLSELSAAYKTGLISAETYFKTKRGIIQEELNDLDISTDAYENYVEQLKTVYPELANVASGIEEVALANMKANQGLNTLNDNWKDWIYKFDQFGEGTPQYAANLANMQTSLAQLLNVDNVESIDANFIDTNRQLIYDIVVSGDIDKLDELQKQYAKDNLKEIEIVANIANESYDSVDTFIDELDKEIDSLDVGGGLSQEFASNLTQMVINSGEAADDILNIFTQMGLGVSKALSLVLAINQTEGADWAEKAANFMAFSDQETLKGFGLSSQAKDAAGSAETYINSVLSGYYKTSKDKLMAGSDGWFKMPDVKDSLQLDDDGDGGDKNLDTSIDKQNYSEADAEKFTEQLELERDIYHDVNIEIEKTNNLLDKLAEKEDELVGNAYLENLQEQNDALEKQNEFLEAKMEIHKSEQKRLQKEIGDSSGGALTFADDGTLKGYLEYTKDSLDAIENARLDAAEATEKYNNAVAAYEAELEKYENLKDSFTSQTEADAAKKVVADAQAAVDVAKLNMDNLTGSVDEQSEAYSKLLELIKEYEELVFGQMHEDQMKIEDNVDKMIENEIKSLNYSIDVELDLADAERQWNEFKWKVLEKGTRFSLFGDDILGEAEMLMQNLQTYPESINGLMNQVQKYMGIINGGGQFKAGTNMEDAIENAEKYRDELMATMESVEDAIQKIQQLYLDMIDAAKDAFDDHIAQYELVNDILEHNINLIKKLDGEDSFDAMGQYYEEMEQNNNANLAFQREQVEFWKQRMEAEEYGSEAWLEYKKNWQNAMSELNSTVEASVDNLIAKYQNTVSSIMADLSKSLTGNDFGLDYLEEEWNLLNENADFYLDKVNSMFAIDELQGKYIDAINNTDNLKAQEQLTKIMNEQVAALEEKGNLTEYDVERANLLYEIELKKIALEEAQQNKSKMRLRRDSQGNYSYQFTADEDAIAQTQNELDKLKNSLYNLDKEAFRNNLNEVLRLQQEYQDKIAELFMDQTLTAEEREAKIADLTQYYGSLINKHLEENAVIRTNLEESTFSAMADTQEKIVMDEMIPQWDSGVQQMIDKMVAKGGFGPTVHDTLEDLRESHIDYEKSLQKMADAAGIDLDAIRGGYDTVHESVEQLIEQSEGELMNTWGEQLDKMSALVGSLAAYDDALESTRQEVKDLIDELNKLIATQKKANGGTVSSSGGDNGKTDAPSNKTPKDDGDGGGGSNKPSNDSGKDDSKSNLPNYPEKDWQIAESIHVNGDYGTASTGTLNNKEVSNLRKARVEYMGGNYRNVQDIVNQWYINAKQAVLDKWAKTTALKYTGPAFDTGGYTGQWGNEGKVAMLHEKELVLNKTDTENILAAVDIVRTISSVIDNLERNVSARISDLSNLNIPTPPAQNTQTIEQQVHIDATFPNVQNSNEIEEAFNNLVNIASQYAFRNKR